MPKVSGVKNKKIFPTNHPFKNLDGSPSTSNVRMGSFGFEDGTRVIPTMVDGELLSTAAALQRARSEGLNKYPLFPSQSEAENWIEKNHSRINAQGELVEQRKRK